MDLKDDKYQRSRTISEKNEGWTKSSEGKSFSPMISASGGRAFPPIGRKEKNLIEGGRNSPRSPHSQSPSQLEKQSSSESPRFFSTNKSSTLRFKVKQQQTSPEASSSSKEPEKLLDSPKFSWSFASSLESKRQQVQVSFGKENSPPLRSGTGRIGRPIVVSEGEQEEDHFENSDDEVERDSEGNTKLHQTLFSALSPNFENGYNTSPKRESPKKRERSGLPEKVHLMTIERTLETLLKRGANSSFLNNQGLNILHLYFDPARFHLQSPTTLPDEKRNEEEYSDFEIFQPNGPMDGGSFNRSLPPSFFHTIVSNSGGRALCKAIVQPDPRTGLPPLHSYILDHHYFCDPQNSSKLLAERCGGTHCKHDEASHCTKNGSEHSSSKEDSLKKFYLSLFRIFDQAKKREIDLFKVVDVDGRSILHLAAQNPNLELLSLLADMAPSVGLRDIHQSTPLHYAVKNELKDHIRVLVEYGADLDSCDENGVSPRQGIEKSENTKENLFDIAELKSLRSMKTSKNQLKELQFYSPPLIKRCLKDFSGEDGELSVEKDQILSVWVVAEGWALSQNVKGKKGLVPCMCIFTVIVMKMDGFGSLTKCVREGDVSKRIFLDSQLHSSLSSQLCDGGSTPASLDHIIDVLCQPLKGVDSFRESFLLMYHKYLKSDELLHALILRYLLGTYNTMNVRFVVVMVIAKWMKLYWDEDWKTDQKLRQMLDTFLNIAEIVHQGDKTDLVNILESKERTIQNHCSCCLFSHSSMDAKECQQCGETVCYQCLSESRCHICQTKACPVKGWREEREGMKVSILIILRGKAFRVEISEYLTCQEFLMEVKKKSKGKSLLTLFVNNSPTSLSSPEGDFVPTPPLSPSVSPVFSSMTFSPITSSSLPLLQSKEEVKSLRKLCSSPHMSDVNFQEQSSSKEAKILSPNLLTRFHQPSPPPPPPQQQQQQQNMNTQGALGRTPISVRSHFHLGRAYDFKTKRGPSKTESISPPLPTTTSPTNISPKNNLLRALSPYSHKKTSVIKSPTWCSAKSSHVDRSEHFVIPKAAFASQAEQQQEEPILEPLKPPSRNSNRLSRKSQGSSKTDDDDDELWILGVEEVQSEEDEELEIVNVKVQSEETDESSSPEIEITNVSFCSPNPKNEEKPEEKLDDNAIAQRHNSTPNENPKSTNRSVRKKEVASLPLFSFSNHEIQGKGGPVRGPSKKGFWGDNFDVESEEKKGGLKNLGLKFIQEIPKMRGKEQEAFKTDVKPLKKLDSAKFPLRVDLEGNLALEIVSKSTLVMSLLDQQKELCLGGTGGIYRCCKEMDRLDPPSAPTDPFFFLNHESPSMSLFQRSASQISQQITLYQHSLYSSITKREILQWPTSKDKSKDCPSLSFLIDHFNRLAKWMVWYLVHRMKMAERVQFITKLVGVCRHCLELNNFLGLKAVLSALSHSAVLRMTKTLDELEEDVLKEWGTCKEIMSHERNFANYRQRLSETNPPFIPFVGCDTKDLLFMFDGIPDLASLPSSSSLPSFQTCSTSDESFSRSASLSAFSAELPKGINVSKICKISETIHQFFRGTLETYPILYDEERDKWALMDVCVNDGQLDDWSRIAEPKNVEEKMQELVDTQEALQKEINELKAKLQQLTPTDSQQNSSTPSDEFVG